MDPHELFEAELIALDRQHARETGSLPVGHVPALYLATLRDLNQLRAHTEEALRSLYIEDAWEPSRITRRPLWRCVPEHITQRGAA